jgi:hypothetical protein
MARRLFMSRDLRRRDHNPIINKKTVQKIKIENHSFTAFSWFAGWLFTIGFLHLTFGKGVLAILLWPYYIGLYISALVK